MSSLPWPSFWEHIPEADRDVLSDVLTELLATGVLLGTEGRGRTQYLTARDYRREIAEYLAPLHLDLIEDPENSLLQARPIPGECGLTARFSKAESLLLLVLWRIYDDIRQSRVTPIVLTSAREVFEKWRLYFERIEAPSEPQLERILSRFRRLRLIRLQSKSEVENFSDLGVEILPTLPRVIPFENEAAWVQQAEVYRDGGGPDSDSDTDGGDAA